jgi:hypothetical protein
MNLAEARPAKSPGQKAGNAEHITVITSIAIVLHVAAVSARLEHTSSTRR